MATEIDEAGVRFIVENLESYLAQIGVANGATTGIGTNAEKAATSNGIAWKKIGAAAVAGGVIIAAAAVGIGVALLKIGSAFDDASDAIAIKTGATGPALAGLEESFKKVFSAIPADGGDVAAAIGALNQKLDLTGQPLEAVATQVLELSRLTGTDLTANLDAVAGAFQRWQTPAEAMPGILDELFRASQESGVPVADLATSLGANKAVIDGLGLTLPDAITLIAGMGKAGIDGDTAFQGLKLAMTKMAKEGVEDPKAALEDYFKRIKDAPTDAAAAAIATDIFGKSSINMASAIRDGSLDLGAFTKDLGENQNTIIGTGKATNDWQEKLKILTNKLMLEVAPAAAALFDAVTKGVDEVGPAIERFVGFYRENIEPAVKDAVQTFKTDWLPIIERIGQQIDDFWKQVAKPVFDALLPVIQDIGRIFKETAQLVGSIIDGDFSAAFEHLKLLFQALIQYFIDAVSGLATAFFDINKFFFGKILEVIDAVAGDAIRAVVGFLGDVITAIASFGGAMLSAGKDLFEKVSDGMMSVPILSDVIGLGGDIAGAVAGFATGMWQRGYDILNVLWDGLKAAWAKITDWLSSLKPDLPDIPGLGITIPVSVDLDLQRLNLPDDPNWVIDWFNKQQDAERLREMMKEAWDAWLEQHPLELKPPHVKIDWKRLPGPITIPDELTPGQLNPVQSGPGGELTPDQQNDKFKPLKPGEKTTKPTLDQVSDPAQLLQLIMQAIATIEAIAGSDIPPVNKRKLQSLAKSLRAIIIEFSSTLKGIKPEAAEAAAIIASMLDPILDAINKAVDAIDSLAGAGGVGLPKIKQVLETIAAITRESILRFGKMNVADLTKTAETSALVADIVTNVRRAAVALSTGNGSGGGAGGGGGGLGDGTIVGGGGIPGAIGDAADKFAAVLAGIAGSLPGRGAMLLGAPGGVTYQVQATYLNAQSPSSIRMDLAEIAMLANA